MLGKTLILGLISAGAAGSVVYYGTAPQGSESLEAHPHNAMKAEKTVRKDRERIEPRLPTIRKGESDDGRKKLASGGGWPDGTDNAPVDEDVEDQTSEDMTSEGMDAETDIEPKKQTRWLDQYLKNNKGAETDTLEVEVFDEAQERPNDSNSASATNSYTVTERSAIDDIEPETMPDDIPAVITEAKAEENNVADPRSFRIENGKLVEIDTTDDVMNEEDMTQIVEAQRASKIADEMMPEPELKNGPHSEPKIFVPSITDIANDSTPLISTVMREAAAISKAELRDQAYFEITEYALSEGRYDSARMAHDMIEQEELSYTAKSRIAVAFAQNGQPSKAFKVIGEVDEAELRDFMRLQVIEALIAPERLPATWQEKAN